MDFRSRCLVIVMDKWAKCALLPVVGRGEHIYVYIYIYAHPPSPGSIVVRSSGSDRGRRDASKHCSARKVRKLLKFRDLWP